MTRLPDGTPDYDPRVIEPDHDEAVEDARAADPGPEPRSALESARQSDPVWPADARPTSNVTQGRFGK